LIADKARFRHSKKFQKETGIRTTDRMFNGSFLDVIDSGVDFGRLDPRMREEILQFWRDFMNCKCRDSPHCGCPERKFAIEILELRELGLDHRQISEHLLDVYGIDIYPADILGFLEESVHVLEAIKDVAALEGEEELAQKTYEHIKNIERGKKS
jgi:superfamily II helicase